MSHIIPKGIFGPPQKSLVNPNPHPLCSFQAVCADNWQPFSSENTNLWPLRTTRSGPRWRIYLSSSRGPIHPPVPPRKLLLPLGYPSKLAETPSNGNNRIGIDWPSNKTKVSSVCLSLSMKHELIWLKVISSSPNGYIAIRRTSPKAIETYLQWRSGVWRTTEVFIGGARL